MQLRKVHVYRWICTCGNSHGVYCGNRTVLGLLNGKGLCVRHLYVLPDLLLTANDIDYFIDRIFIPSGSSRYTDLDKCISRFVTTILLGLGDNVK